MHPAPDILHGSYLISEQSPASSHNTPVLSHTRSFNIPIYRPYVKKKFSISAKIFGIFFVQVYEINFGENNPLGAPTRGAVTASAVTEGSPGVRECHLGKEKARYIKGSLAPLCKGSCRGATEGLPLSALAANSRENGA